MITVDALEAGVHLNLKSLPLMSASNVANDVDFRVPYCVNVTDEPSCTTTISVEWKSVPLDIATMYLAARYAVFEKESSVNSAVDVFV